MPKSAQITKREKFGYDIIDIRGDLSSSSREWADKIISLYNDEPRSIILNIEEVTFLNSTGLAYLVKVFQNLCAKGFSIYLMGGNETINSLLRSSGTKRFFTFLSSEKEFIERNKKKELDDILDID